MTVLEANTEDVPGLPVVPAPANIPLLEPDRRLIEAVSLIPASVWFDIASWAAQTENLKPYQRSMAFNIGRTVAMKKLPSIKLAKYGPEIIEDAWIAGFRHQDLDASALSRLRAL